MTSVFYLGYHFPFFILYAVDTLSKIDYLLSVFLSLWSNSDLSGCLYATNIVGAGLDPPESYR